MRQPGAALVTGNVLATILQKKKQRVQEVIGLAKTTKPVHAS